MKITPNSQTIMQFDLSRLLNPNLQNIFLTHFVAMKILYPIFTFLHKEPLLENMFQMLCSQCVHSIRLCTICKYLALAAHKPNPRFLSYIFWYCLLSMWLLYQIINWRQQTNYVLPQTSTNKYFFQHNKWFANSCNSQVLMTKRGW